MKVLAGIAAVAALIGTPALAADMPLKAPAMAPVYDWTGFYVGGHVGGAWGHTTWLEDATGSGTGVGPVGLVDGSYNMSGFLGGGQVGFNYQTGRFVWGIEADLSDANIRGGTGNGGCFATVGGDQSCSTRIDWLGTVTGRIGLAFDRSLVYVKGGYAEAHENHQDPFNFGVGAASIDAATETRTGWTIGTGVEYAWAGPWSVKLEYDYIGLGTRDLTFTDPLGGSYTEDVRQNLSEVKAGINYRFGWPH